APPAPGAARVRDDRGLRRGADDVCRGPRPRPRRAAPRPRRRARRGRPPPAFPGGPRPGARPPPPHRRAHAARPLELKTGGVGRGALPTWRLGRPVQPGFETIGAYGGGLTTFAVLGVRGSAGRHLVPDAVTAGGTPLVIAGGAAAEISAPLLNAVIVRPPGF